MVVNDALSVQLNTSPSASSPSDAEMVSVLSVEDQRFLDTLKINYRGGFNFRQRRHGDWEMNYSLYRDKVFYNRLTQRQSVNAPLMKWSIKTLLKDIDDAPMLSFKCRDNDAQKEVFYNEYWKEMARCNKLTIKDIVDKKQVLLYGRSFKKLNIRDGKFYFEIIDPQDIIVDRYVDPANLDSANYMAHEYIFRTLSSLSQNSLYDQAAIKRLQLKYATAQGLVKANENNQSLIEKNDRLRDLGDIDVDNPQLGETYIELVEHYIKIFDSKLKRDIIWFAVTADGEELLCKKPLHEMIGKTADDFWFDHFPFTSWGEDVERTDFWNDGVGDTLRTSNVILNSWTSQMVENRTLRNLGMHYYNSDLPNFVPQTYEPSAFAWFPLPLGKEGEIDINKVLMKVDIPELSESLDEIQFIITLAEKASGATGTQQGMTTKDVLLGDIKLALQNAQERTKGMSSLYTDSWEEFGLKYTKMIEAAGDMLDAVTVYKKGKNTDKLYSKTIASNDWKTELGYQCEVKDLTHNTSHVTDQLQKLSFTRSLMPNNIVLLDIIKQKALEFSELSAIDVQRVLEADKIPPPVNPMLGPGGSATPGMGGTPMNTQPAGPKPLMA